MALVLFAQRYSESVGSTACSSFVVVEDPSRLRSCRPVSAWACFVGLWPPSAGLFCFSEATGLARRMVMNFGMATGKEAPGAFSRFSLVSVLLFCLSLRSALPQANEECGMPNPAPPHPLKRLKPRVKTQQQHHGRQACSRWMWMSTRSSLTRHGPVLRCQFQRRDDG
jgi:hypothetical protein